MSNKLILIDGNAILHRSYHAYPQTLKVSTTGELTNAVYGFAVNLLNVVHKFNPTNVIVAFDVKGKTFRHEKFDGYKASRPKMDEELVGQISRVRELVSILNIPQFGVQGFEADDVIGTLAVKASKDMNVMIVTGDKDALQLVDENINVYFPSRGRKIPERVYDVAKFKDEWKFEPIKLIDFKSLAGDSSDEIPGVRGVGPKTATDLIVKYGYLEDIYENLNDIKDSVRVKLECEKENAFLSKMLATIIKDVPVEWSSEASVLKEYDKEKAEEFFMNMEFMSLIRRLPSSTWELDVEEVFSPKEKKVDEKTVVSDGQVGMF